MSIRRFSALAVALMMTIAGVSVSNAQSYVQKELQRGPSTRPFDVPPAPEPNFFDYDYQMWAPLDVTNLDGTIPVQNGYYASFDYSYLSVTRPGPAMGSRYHWAKTYEMGYYSDSGAGLNLIWQSLRGADYLFGQDGRTSAGDPGLVSNPMLLNTSFDSVDLNIAFRQMLRNRQMFEPYFGLRFISLSDKTIEDARIAAAVDDRFLQNVTNNAIGGQVGSRYTVRRGRWEFIADGAFAAMYNQQRYAAEDITIDNRAGANPLVISEHAREATTFLPALDLSFYSTFNITRDISLRGGAHFLASWNGLARVDSRSVTQNNPNSSTNIITPPVTILSQDYTQAGFSFGFEWRR